MENWHTDKLIGIGLIFALILWIGGGIAIALTGGEFPVSDMPGNIVTGLAGYMGRAIVEQNKHKKTSKTKKKKELDTK